MSKRPQRSGNYFRPFYRRHKLRFECTQCGRCCVGGNDRHVYVSEFEAEKIRLALGVGRSWFRKRYTALTGEGDYVLQSRGERCVFLQSDGTCRVYTARPTQCSSYPFWPEIVKTARTWKREAGRCEGIGRGKTVSVREIEMKLLGAGDPDDGKSVK